RSVSQAALPASRSRSMTSAAAWSQPRAAFNNDSRESRFSERIRPTSSLVNRSSITNTSAWRQTRLGVNNRWADSSFRQRPPTNSFYLNKFEMRDAAARRDVRQSFNNYWANSRPREQVPTNKSFVNRSVGASYWTGRQTHAFSSNWQGAAFERRQYWAFRNYEPQWHNSGWWHDHSDRIVFVTIYSQPFPFYFDAGY